MGEKHPNVATSYDNIGAVYNCLGDYIKAIECYKEALAIYTEFFGTDAKERISTIIDIANVYFEMNENEKAVEYIKIGAENGNETCIEWLRENGIE